MMGSNRINLIFQQNIQISWSNMFDKKSYLQFIPHWILLLRKKKIRDTNFIIKPYSCNQRPNILFSRPVIDYIRAQLTS